MQHGTVLAQGKLVYSPQHLTESHKTQTRAFGVIAVRLISSGDLCTGLQCSWIRLITATVKRWSTGVPLPPQLFPSLLFPFSISCLLNPSTAQPIIYSLLCRREGAGLAHILGSTSIQN